jgi:hypothetical protein
MPIHARRRLIQFHRIQRAANARALHRHRTWAINTRAFQPLTLAPQAPQAGGHQTHSIFALGPILFCKRCGATKSFSGGSSLSRPCRRWAPAGTRGLITAFLKGKAPTPFYRNILRNAAIPIRRLHTKTRPTPRLLLPSHLVPPIHIQSHTVLCGAAFRPPAIPPSSSD